MARGSRPIVFDHMYERIMIIGLVLVGGLCLVAGLLSTVAVFAVDGVNDRLWIFALVLVGAGAVLVGLAYAWFARFVRGQELQEQERAARRRRQLGLPPN